MQQLKWNKHLTGCSSGDLKHLRLFFVILLQFSLRFRVGSSVRPTSPPQVSPLRDDEKRSETAGEERLIC